MNDREPVFSRELEHIRKIDKSPLPHKEKLQSICNYLRESIARYDWVGFYFVDQARERELVLGPFAGEPTEHIRIPFGRGICGRAAEIAKTVVIDDVGKESNYLSCNIKVKSEIVLPLFKNGRIIGELDIDSHTGSAFAERDRVFLEAVCKIVERLI